MTLKEQTKQKIEDTKELILQMIPTRTSELINDTDYNYGYLDSNLILHLLNVNATLSSSQTIVSNGSTMTINALVTDSDGNTVSNAPVQFYINGTASGNPINTNSNGIATYTYSGTGIGKVKVYAKVGTFLSETYEVCDCKYYIPIRNNSLEYGGIYHQNMGKTTVELSNEWSTVGDYSIKGTTITWGWFAWRYVNQIDNPTVKFDVNTDYPISAFLYVNNNESVSIDIPSGVGTYELTIDTSEITNDRVELRIVNKSSLYTATCYIDNIRLF